MRQVGVSIGVVTLAAAVAAASGKPAPPFDGGRAYEHVRQLVAFGPRPAGSAALEASRKYILARLAEAAVTAVQQRFDAETPIGRVPMVNLIATIPGARPERIVVGGHYETKLFREFPFVGANDGGSSAAFLIELARVLKARTNPFTMEVLFLDGEEAFVEWGGSDRTYGSRHYVAEARRSGTLSGLQAFILVDMIGDRNLVIRREAQSTRWLTDLIWAAARRLAHSAVFVDESTSIEDDHLPFLEAGVPAVDIIDLEYPPWHTAQDTLDKVSARSLQIVGDVLMEALPAIEARLIQMRPRAPAPGAAGERRGEAAPSR